MQFTSWGGAVLLVDCQSMAEVGWQMGIPYYSLPAYLPFTPVQDEMLA